MHCTVISRDGTDDFSINPLLFNFMSKLMVQSSVTNGFFVKMRSME